MIDINPVNTQPAEHPMMNTRKLLAALVAAQVAGDKVAVAEAMKKYVAEKTRSLIAEQAQPNANGIINWHEIQGFDFFGPFEIELKDGDVENLPAGLYEMCVSADVEQYGKTTQGNFSPVAADPDEYYGQQAEYEVKVSAVQLYEYQDDQAVAELQGPAAAALVDENMENHILEMTKDSWSRESDDHPDMY